MLLTKPNLVGVLLICSTEGQLSKHRGSYQVGGTNDKGQWVNCQAVRRLMLLRRQCIFWKQGLQNRLFPLGLNAVLAHFQLLLQLEWY